MNQKPYKIRPSQLIEGVLHYSCTKCGEWKPVAKFSALGRQLMDQSRCKVRSMCKVCETIDRRRYPRRRRPTFSQELSHDLDR